MVDDKGKKNLGWRLDLGWIESTPKRVVLDVFDLDHLDCTSLDAPQVVNLGHICLLEVLNEEVVVVGDSQGAMRVIRESKASTKFLDKLL